ncbi:ABC-type Fe3+/spermidine/putrescine transport systems, ATPase components [Mesonia phycicola]|uniref:ABC-type Fe3+/spermidine/putrescine transport systems, ATPase components n=1 Tax=Mesonia phycicola TaxID=579105 RepID=A0A1M6D6W7_9FLAO|nr:ABC transporter ATP-binding protein [Mesonia phycicola]SHI68986.1 ABC-type Fe3+/spermidine/putrescine transport systems, ATPase components [Mesonia phycicola]
MLKVNQVLFAYQNKATLQNIQFSVKKGSHTCIIGESGCGKSTLLKAVYGLLDLEEGSIYWNNEQVLGPAFNLVPGHPKMKYLAQEDHLMPYTTVSENIQKYLSRQYSEKSKQRTEELLEVIDMLHFAKTKVKNLSGGQKQRVALAQVLAREPELLLLDEPFNFIDNFRKNKLRRNIFNYLKKQKITCLFATHDSTDMLGFADQALVMKNGELIANNTPEQLYNLPPNQYIASLFKEVNVLKAELFEELTKEGIVLLYPSELKIHEEGKLTVKVKKCYFNGDHYFVETICKNNQLLYVNSKEELPTSSSIKISYPEDLLEKRLVQN